MGEDFILDAVLRILDELDASTAALRKADREGADALPMTLLVEPSDIPDRFDVIDAPGEE